MSPGRRVWLALVVSASPSCAFPDYVAEAVAEDATAGDAMDAGAEVGDVAGDAADVVEAAPVDAGPPGCTGMKPTDGWGAPARLAKLRTGNGSDAADQPYALPDGLTLYFQGPDGFLKRRLHVATRADRSTEFAGGAVVSLSDTAGSLKGKDQTDPAAFRLEELFFAAQNDVFMGVRAATVDPFTVTRLVAPVASGEVELTPTLSADGLRMVFGRVNVTTLKYHLVEAARADATAGTAWSVAVDLTTLSGAGQLCPALSADGLTLYYAVSTGGAATEVNVVQRASLADSFGPSTKVPVLGPAGVVNCPRSVTADGCELYLSSGGFASVAKRVPAK